MGIKKSPSEIADESHYETVIQMAIPQTNKNDVAADQDLVRLAASGDSLAKRKLVERLMPKVRTTVHYLAPGDNDADDLVQLAFIEILRSIGKFRGDCKVETWASKIAVRTALHYLKARRNRIKRLLSRPSDAPDEMPNPEQISEQIRFRRRIKLLLHKLPVEQRTVIVLKLVLGLSLTEIADVADSPLNTVRERLRVGRKKFRTYLAQDPVLNEWIERRPQ